MFLGVLSTKLCMEDPKICKENPKDSAWPIPLAYVVPILFIGNITYITFTYGN